jgi:hypothetical protein
LQVVVKATAVRELAQQRVQPTPPLRHFEPEKMLVVQAGLAQEVSGFAVARLTQTLGV